MNLANLLASAARAYPDNPAMHLGARVLWNYRQLAARAAAIAGALRERPGIAPGERALVFLPNRPEYLEILYGIWWGGLVAVPVNYKLHPKEAEFILRDSGAKIAFVADADAVEGLLPEETVIVGGPAYEAMLARTSVPALVPVSERGPTDLAWLFYTSGTTGRPKGVMLSNRNLMAMTSAYFMNVADTSSQDAFVYAAPMSHGAGLYNLAAVVKAARHVVPESGGFEPDELIGLASSVGQLSMFAAPTMVRRLTDRVSAAGADTSGFKTIVYGGGPMYAEDIKRALAAMGPKFVQIYGQGESPMTITALPREVLADTSHPQREARIASVGFAHSVVEVRIVDGEGRALPAGEIGEVTVRGDTVMAGYWNNPEATAKTLREGWLWTGDMGSLDEDGFLTLKDRSKDVIISGGSNIYPREVEEVLLMHPAVKETAVIGKPDPEWGETVIAFVVAPGIQAQELDALCLEHIARFKRPKEYRFVDALPKNNYGKVLKTELRRMLSQA